MYKDNPNAEKRVLMTNALAIFFPVFETNAENLNNAKKKISISSNTINKKNVINPRELRSTNRLTSQREDH